MKEDKQGWETPQLIAITRQQPGANVLGACKSGYSAGPNEKHGSCYTTGPYSCDTCSSRPNS